jgi:hypothetical protein
MALPDEAVHELTALAGVVLSHESIDECLIEICCIAVRAVPGAEGASLTAFSEKGPGAVAASDDWSKALDEMQYGEHEGPCLDAARTSLVFRVPDMAHEPRWPSYMPRAVAQGARSMISLPMATEGKTIGALNIYARVPAAFDAEATSIGEIIAGHASLASQVSATLFRHRETAEQLREAMEARMAIEQAKGILIGQRGCSPQEASRSWCDSPRTRTASCGMSRRRSLRKRPRTRTSSGCVDVRALLRPAPSSQLTPGAVPGLASERVALPEPGCLGQARRAVIVRAFPVAPGFGRTAT